MYNLKELSDEELRAISDGPAVVEQKKGQSTGVESMSDDELFEIAMGKNLPALPKPKESAGLGEMALNTVGFVADKLDSVTGAPTRAAIGAVQDGKNPLSAFKKQFAEDPSKAPTGKMIAERMGLDGETELSTVLPDLYSDTGEEWLKFKRHGLLDPTKAGAAGLGIDVLADWSNLATAGTLSAAKNIGKSAASKGAQIAGKTITSADNLLTGGKVVKAADKIAGTSGEIVKGISKFVTPSIDKDFVRLATIAQKNGIDPALLPEAIEFGDGSFISRAARHNAEGPIGQAALEKFTAGRNAVEDALKNKITKISGGANVADEILAGQIIRQGYDEGIDQFFKQADMTHNSILQMAPGMPLSETALKKLDSKLSGIEKFAKGRMARGVTKTQRVQGDQLLRAVEAIRSGNGSYKQALEALRDIGEVAFKSKNSLADITPDIEKLRDLYFTLDDALLDTVQSNLGDDIADALRGNNKNISNFLKENALVSDAVGSKSLSNEALFKSLILNGNSKQINALKKILPPEKFQALKGAALEAIAKADTIDGAISFKKIRGGLNAKRNQLSTLFDAKELEEIGELVELGDRFGSPVLSSSGTGASNVFRDVGEGVRDHLYNSTIIDAMKNRARLRGADQIPETLRSSIPLPVPPKPPSSGLIGRMSPEDLISPKAKIATGFAKPMSTNESNAAPDSRLIEQVSYNPDLLKSIRNPTLRFNLEKAARKRREQMEVDGFQKTLEAPRDAQEQFLEGN